MARPRTILMLRDYTGPLGHYRDGGTYEVLREIARALVACGAAQDVTVRGSR